MMKIKAVKLYDGGFMMKSFACGGGLPEGSIKEEKLRSSLQNFVIDTGDEIILVDTGFPAEEEFPVTKDSVITFGDKIADYVEALKAAGYEPAQVSKILVTHKHRQMWENPLCSIACCIVAVPLLTPHLV